MPWRPFSSSAGSGGDRPAAGFALVGRPDDDRGRRRAAGAAHDGDARLLLDLAGAGRAALGRGRLRGRRRRDDAGRRGLVGRRRRRAVDRDDGDGLAAERVVDRSRPSGEAGERRRREARARCRPAGRGDGGAPDARPAGRAAWSGRWPSSCLPPRHQPSRVLRPRAIRRESPARSRAHSRASSCSLESGLRLRRGGRRRAARRLGDLGRETVASAASVSGPTNL